MAEGGQLTSDAKVSFTKQPTVDVGAATLEAGTTMQVKLPSNTTRVSVFGTTDQTFGKYEAFLSTQGTSELNKTSGDAGRAQSQLASQPLYYETTLSPLTETAHTLNLRADGTVGLQTVEVCYST